MSDGALAELARIYGIHASWRDIAGRAHLTSTETQRALLTAMGREVTTRSDIANALAAHHAAEAGRVLPPELVTQVGNFIEIPVPSPTEWRLELDDGSLTEGKATDAIHLTPTMGVHRLIAGNEVCLLIAAPAQAPSTFDITGRGQLWGFTGPLYGLRSDRNLGVGDYGDLAVAAASLGALGADYLGINPIHALGAASTDVSPYSPSSRVAYDTGPIAVDQVEGFSDSDKARAILAGNARQLDAAREVKFADYGCRDAVARPVLRAIFDETHNRLPFADKPSSFAMFEALSLIHGEDWRDWPPALRNPASTETAEFARQHAQEVAFHQWLQTRAKAQIARAQDRALSSGMALGLYLDIAVGVRPSGADVWSDARAFAQRVSLGAPPDLFSPEGQNWTLAPFSPIGLRDVGYRPFIECLRASMTFAGVVRIDHVLGFARAYWVPQDGTPGGYVTYPLEALLAITKIEATRAGCLVVGEDLGSVPDGFRDQLAQSGILGCAIMPFERKDDALTQAEHYRRNSIASFGTHDMPTIKGWWTGHDIEARAAIRCSAPDEIIVEKGKRARGKVSLTNMLTGTTAGPDQIEPDDTSDATIGRIGALVHTALARANSALVAVQIDDALGALEQQNLPGTTDAYPNWRRKVDVDVRLMKSDPRLTAVAEIMERRRGKDEVPAISEKNRCT